jgi:hypothetical protein
LTKAALQTLFRRLVRTGSRKSSFHSIRRRISSLSLLLIVVSGANNLVRPMSDNVVGRAVPCHLLRCSDPRRLSVGPRRARCRLRLASQIARDI